jgi:PAS domain S-box-containing protein
MTDVVDPQWELLLCVADQLGHATFAKDSEGRYRHVNAAAARILGASPEEIVGRTDFAFMDSASATEVRARDALVLSSRGAMAHQTQAFTGGRLRTFKSVKAPWRNASGELLGIVGISTETSASPAQGREELLAYVAHELKGPLAIIRLLTQQLYVEMRGSRGASRILSAVSQMNKLVEDLLDFSAVRRGRFSVVPKDCGIREVIDSGLELLEPLAQRRGIQLVRDFTRCRARVSCDERRVHQVLTNVITNALKFCSEGAKIVVDAATVGTDVHVSITDDGPGFAQEEADRIFEPYQQLQSGNRGDVGLGLSICKQIIEAHGGRIWAESRASAGCSIHFTLRRIPAPKQLRERTGPPLLAAGLPPAEARGCEPAMAL